MGKNYKLGEIFRIRSGYTPDTQEKKYWCSHKEECECVPWFTGKDITEKNVGETARKITPLAVRELKMKLTTENSVLFNYLECSPYYLGVKGITCQGGGGTHILEPNLELVEPNYLYYLLLSVKEKMRSWRSGTAQLKIRGQELVRIEVALPALERQRLILSKFRVVYDKIFKSEVIYNDRVREVVKTVLEYGDCLFLKYKDSQIKIKDHFQLIRGKTPPTNNKEYYEKGTIKWINSGVLTNLYFLTGETKASKLVSEKAVRECQLNYARLNSVLISGIDFNIDDKIVWNRTNDFVAGTGIYGFISDNQLENAALFFALRNTRKNIIQKICLKGATQFTSIRGSELVNFPLWWVSNLEKQKKLWTILNSRLAEIKDLHEQIKDLLLLKYFGGKK